MENSRVGSGHNPREAVTRGSGQHDPRVVFYWPVGRTRAFGSRIRHGYHIPLSYPESSLVPILNNTPLVSYSSIKTPPNLFTHARIHLYPLQLSHISLRETNMKASLFLNYRPTGPIRGSDLRVRINGLAAQGGSTRMKPVSHGSIKRVAGRVGSGQEALKSRESGRVGS